MASVSAELKGERGLQRIMRRYPKQVKQELTLELRAATLDVRDDAKVNAPEQSGNLRNSIQEDFKKLDELYSEVKTVLEYAAAHEYGFTGTVQVPAHTRTQTHYFGEPVAPTEVNVSAHTRKMDIPGTHYMTKAAKTKKRTFKRDIAKAIRRAAPNG